MILISPTAFKGTLSPFEAARAIAFGLRRELPRVPMSLVPLADGGDGTLEVLARALSANVRKKRVQGPLGRFVKARWALARRVANLSGPVAIIEMAEASGLKHVRGKNKIRQASTVGTGELIKAALDAKCRTILIGVGGTATADGGAGALWSLGLRYRDSRGHFLDPYPNALGQLRSVDWSGLDPRLERTKIIVLCDVTNPLLGKNGSARVFGPQKGATPADVVFLERFLGRWSRFARANTIKTPGAGAAGALAYGLSAFLKARLADGGRFILEVSKWKRAAHRAKWVITGEGQLDQTSFSGKTIGAAAQARGRARIAVVCGKNRLSRIDLKKRGVFAVEEIGPQGLVRPVETLRKASERLGRRIRKENG